MCSKARAQFPTAKFHRTHAGAPKSANGTPDFSVPNPGTGETDTQGAHGESG